METLYCVCGSPVMDPEYDAGCRRCGRPVDFTPLGPPPAPFACRPDESAGVREGLEDEAGEIVRGMSRELLLACLASGLRDWADPRITRARLLARIRGELVRRYECHDCGAPAGTECRPEFGCDNSSRRPGEPGRFRQELEELRAGRDPRD